MLKYTSLITPWCNGSTSGFGPLSSGSNPDGVTIFYPKKKVSSGDSSMKILNYSVFSFALLLLFTLIPSDLSAQKIGAVTIQETQQAVDAVLYETTPKLNEYDRCGKSSNCSTGGYYCRSHNRIRSKRRCCSEAYDRDYSCSRRRSSQRSCGRSRSRTSSCSSRRTSSCRRSYYRCDR